MKIALPSLKEAAGWTELCSDFANAAQAPKGELQGYHSRLSPKSPPLFKPGQLMSHQSGGPSCFCSAGLLTQSDGTLDKWEAQWSEG